jgi:hypothetical protein
MTDIGAHPQRLDIYVHPGDPIAIAIPVLDSTGATESLSGWTAAATVKTPDGQLLHDFAPSIASDQIQVAATSQQTGAWAWSAYAARLTITATPPAGGAAEIATGWIRLYNP